MYRQNLLGLGTLAIILCTDILMITLSSLKAQAITFPPTESRGAPTRTVGGGQRGGISSSSCVDSSLPLTALTPNNNVVTTVTGSPTMFWYVPKTEAKSAEFVILNGLNEVYKTTVSIKDVPGIVKLKIPTSVSLETGKKYLWKFSLICNSENQSEEKVVAGYLERTELNVEAKRAIATTSEPLKQVELYANAMIWQETLSLLAQLRLEHPHDHSVSEAWREVLTSVKLEAIASQPLVECCSVAPIEP